MKKVKIILYSISILIIIMGLIIYGYLYYTKPQYDGEVFVKNISKESSVFFDEYGIPHIYATSEKEALTILGYVHAQDRLWQMELLRRIAPGKLSEIFGSKALENDKLFIALGIDENSEQVIKKIDKNSPSYTLSMAYLDGINQYIKQGNTPIEFTLLGIKKEPFTLKDIYNTLGYMAFSFAMAQKTDPLLTDIKNKWGEKYVQELGVNLEYNTTKIQNTHGNSLQKYMQASVAVSNLLDKSPISPFIGSNSWVLSSQKTKTGKVIFANDPHLGFSQPGTWYEAHIVAPNYEVYGFYLAGTPFPLLGHNRNYAYGLTMFENDDADFYEEQYNPINKNQYKSANGYENFIAKIKKIKVKDTMPVILNIKKTRHGVVLNSILHNFNPVQPVAFGWEYTRANNRTLEAVYKLSHSKDLQDFRNGIELIASPGLNVMYGDNKNNIMWQTSGKLYKFKKGVNPNFILNGTNNWDDRFEYFNFSKNPCSINPNNGYVYSANNMPESIDGYKYQGYYLPEDRAKRILQLLSQKNSWTTVDVMKMTVDNVSPVSLQVTKKFVQYTNKSQLTTFENEVIEILNKWEGSNNVNDIPPTIYNKWIYFYLKNTFQDEMGEVGFQQFLKTHIMKQCIANQSLIDNSIWWDNVLTKNKKENRVDIITQSFKEAISVLVAQHGKETNSWKWGKVHQLEFKHPLGQVELLKPLFNVGKFNVGGSNEVINNMMFSYSDEKNVEVSAGPSTRRIIDFNDIENSWSILPTGQSGNPMSKHYDDQAEMFIEGKFRKMRMNKKQIEKVSTRLVFKPNL